MGLINYAKTIWQNGVTKRNATNFNHMETGIEAACNGVDRLDKLTNVTSDITYHKGCVNAGNTMLIKKGNTVTLHLDIYCESGYDGTQYLTLPIGYEPLISANTGIFYAEGQWGVSLAGYMFINPSGAILLYSDNNLKYCHGTITYIV